MFDTSLKISGALLLAAALASCETAGLFPKPGEAYVKEVAVTAAPSARNPVPAGFASRLTEAVRLDTQRLPQTGAAKHLSITLTNYHLKSPAMSLLVGDANYVKGTMTVTDVATGGMPKTAPFIVGNQGQVNGVIGAIQAANQDPILIEGVLVVQSSRKALENFYGTKLLKTYAASPQPAPATPAAASPQAAPAAPAKAKPHRQSAPTT